MDQPHLYALICIELENTSVVTDGNNNIIKILSYLNTKVYKLQLLYTKYKPIYQICTIITLTIIQINK